jgi:phosphate starvation-inducible protein PhoH
LLQHKKIKKEISLPNLNGNGKHHLKKVRIDDLLTFSPITPNQEKTFKAYKEGNHLLLHGIAGTGKTFMSLYLALEEVLDAGTVFDDVFIVRSAVTTRDIGFLPGDEQEKVSIYEAPYRAICRELFGMKDAYDSLKQQNNVKFMSTSFIRGITINNAVLIVDECQNLNFHELDSIITRVGKNSKVIFCGDYTQTDLTRENDRNGIQKFMKILNEIPSFTTVEFEIEDIVRSDFLKDYIIKKYKLGY